MNIVNMPTQGKPLAWQDVLNLFSEEFVDVKHSDVLKRFKSATSENDMLELLYNFQLFRKRINAWHSKNIVKSCNKRGCSSSKGKLDVNWEKDVKTMIQLAYKENPNFAGASSAVELRESPEKGRHVVAVQDIAPGDNLFVEEPFAMVLCDLEGNHCDNCCTELLASKFLCPDCPSPNYCSEECRDEAWRLYHSYECGSCLAQHIGIAQLGLRVTLVAESIGSLRLEGGQGGEKFNEPTKLQEQYERVHNLLTHIDDMTLEDRLQYTLTALLLTVDQIRKRKITSDQRIKFVRNFGGRILRHVAQLVCNGNAITANQTVEAVNGSEAGHDGPVLEEYHRRVATGMYPTASMTNHSCDPNILNSYVGKTLIGRATREIKSGEEIFNCYGPYFRSMKKQDRQAELRQQYFFTCHCGPCSDALSSEFLEAEGIEAALCPQCRGPAVDRGDMQMGPHTFCINCGHTMEPMERELLAINHEKATAALQEAEVLMGTQQLEKAALCVEKALRLQRKYLHHNNRKIAKSLDTLAMLKARQGKLAESLELLEQSLPLLETRYGSQSIELSAELEKMADLAATKLQDPALPDWFRVLKHAEEWVRRAQDIVETLLGPWHPRMHSLQITQQHLQRLHSLSGSS